MEKIPKVIHYIWFGGNPLPELAQKCIESWKKYCPDYEIIEWNEKNFDIHCCPYAEEAYEAKKWAFVSDIARFIILKKYGGLYFDTDVEIIRSIDPIVGNGAFMAQEADGYCAPGLAIGVTPDNPVINEIVDYYYDQHFLKKDGSFDLTTVVIKVSEILKKHGFDNNVYDKIQIADGLLIYPPEYFCPKNYITKEMNITDNTISIHHYDGSWLPPSVKYYEKLKAKYLKYLPYPLASAIARYRSLIRYSGIIGGNKETLKWIIDKIKGKYK
ncbi:MAG: glycosyl transferase [Ruminococcus sp.]|nr:glycosyl transferase [Ruminococcus sp.]